jgi:hypothetical protein
MIVEKLIWLRSHFTFLFWISIQKLLTGLSVIFEASIFKFFSGHANPTQPELTTFAQLNKS